MRGSEGAKGGDKLTDREAETYWVHSPPCFSSPQHPEASPKLLVKKKQQQAAVWWIKQQRQPLPSLPSRRLALIFQSLSVPVLRLLYTLPSKCIFLLSRHRSSPSSTPPHPTQPAMWAEGMIGLQSTSVWICSSSSRDTSLNPLTPFFPIGSSLLWRTFASSWGYTTGHLIYH